MTTSRVDDRSPGRKTQDEQIAAEPRMAAPDLRAEAPSAPVEAYLGRRPRRPVAVAGVVENGLVRPSIPR